MQSAEKNYEMEIFLWQEQNTVLHNNQIEADIK
jgi:hypothetical protein